jgi:ribose 5-phosphate isomerase B
MIFDRVAVGADHRGFNLKQKLVDRFVQIGIEICDFGTENDHSPADYPYYAKRVSQHVLCTESCFGVLVCHSGIGVTIAANRHKGIRAILCDRSEIASLSREHNNANVICFGSKFISAESAIELVEIFMRTPRINDERHARRIREIDEI